MVGSSSISTSPALTFWPSRTWIALTTPVSNGWMTLAPPLGTMRPEAVTTMSTLPKLAQATAKQKAAMIVAAIARPIGEGGLSVISSAAGRKAISWIVRRAAALGNGTIFRLPNCMRARLHVVEPRIAAAEPDQMVVRAVLDDAAVLERDDAVGLAHGRQPVRDDEDGAARRDALHVVLDDALALVVERARRLVEDQDARIADQRARDGDALALAAGQAPPRSPTIVS